MVLLRTSITNMLQATEQSVNAKAYSGTSHRDKKIPPVVRPVPTLIADSIIVGYF